MNVISKNELMRGLLDAKALEKGLLSGAGPGADAAPISGVIPAYKAWGKTPLETLDALKAAYPVLTDVPLSYAGRLDPLAEGLMLVLVGETNKDRERYLHLDKTYEVEVLFGVKTDTGDLFGVPEALAETSALPGLPARRISDQDEDAIKKESNFDICEDKIGEILVSFVGKQQFPYPSYSSKTVQGKPLFQWMNEGRIGEIEIPKTDVEIYSLKMIGSERAEDVAGSCVPGIAGFPQENIIKKVERALAEVKGDFRYESIREGWAEFLSEKAKQKGNDNFALIKIECTCSSGTYMRALAEEIGKKMGVPASAYSIKRTKVNEIGLDAAI